MFDGTSAIIQVPNSILQLEDGTQTIDISSKKLKALLQKFQCYPDNYRKEIWTYLLQLPGNTEAFNQYASRSQLPQARKLCTEKGCGNRCIKIVNSLIHWHAPLINCDWLPPFVEQLVKAFPGNRNNLFIFEVTVTFLTNYFCEWLPNVPGPPPDVLSRIDAIFAQVNLPLRNDLGTAFVGWPVYRSCFAEHLYENMWIQLMDTVFSSSPQLLEFLVFEWLDINAPLLRIDSSTFHSTRRPINLNILIKKALEIEKIIIPSLHSGLVFTPLSSPKYPLIESSSEAVVMRTLQSDHDKLAELQTKLQQERRDADEAEKIKLRKKETFDTIEKLHRIKEDEEKVEMAKAAVDLDGQMKRLRLEGRKLRLADEQHFLEAWKNEWAVNIETHQSISKFSHNQDSEESLIDQDKARFQHLMELRQFDTTARESRKGIINRTKTLQRQLEAQESQQNLHNEITKLANNPNLLTNLSSIKPTSERH